MSNPGLGPTSGPSASPKSRRTRSSGFNKDLDAPTPETPKAAVTTFVASRDSTTSVTARVSRTQNPERKRAPPQRIASVFSISPPRLGNRSNFFRTLLPHSQIYQKPLPSTNFEAAENRSVRSIPPKRTRSPPPSFSADESLQGNSISSTDNLESKILARTKRIARFKVELSKCEQNNADVAHQKASASRHEHSVLKQKYVGSKSMESDRDFSDCHAISDSEDLKTSNIIIGLCPDMCPERAERERKGDLDQYERLDGDRNVTSRLLAVKKYNRQAEREAILIRPMPILRRTIDYLLNLLDQPYDDRFLALYNFLWDRMRAIRMDLRMQHIFNQGSMTMLEQMIRLHITAMHELYEYAKGEGFSEGFDAHLNIEQMNKTSVELFQMYDDHRKKGIYVPTEKEFRGYYALLKLDKHPGYKVEPAELSLDLAKMTPEIRQTPEVLFARDVARACRTGNFIAFFRLARKSSYLQACLMHAHFAKLRTRALASLHAGLQNNQGLPIAQVANWLAMEGEGIEGLLQYHGFLQKEFEEPYMVKEGPFLNVDNDYPTKCSQLVQKKRSGRIIEDVSFSTQAVSVSFETKKEIQMRKIYKDESQMVSSIQKVDEEIPDPKATLSARDRKSGKAFKEIPIGVQDNDKIHYTTSTRPSPLSLSISNNIPEGQLRTGILKSTNSDATFGNSPNRNLHSHVYDMPSDVVPKESPSDSSLRCSSCLSPEPPNVSKDESLPSHRENEDEIDEVRENYQDEEIAVAKLKLFLRLWRRQASKSKMLREQRHFAANAALDLISLGSPIRPYLDKPGIFDKFDIDIAVRERHAKQEKSWARLNVSDTVADILSRRNPGAKCLCWKIVLCSQMNSGYKMGATALWLISKLMPSNDDDVVVSSPGLTIWKKWLPSQSGAYTTPTCCLSVIRDTTFGSLDETVSGASSVLFLVSENIPWELQRAHLHNLLMSIPSGACLPLVILCGSCDESLSSAITNELGLHNIDKSRVSGFLLVFLIENQPMKQLGTFFSDQRLREGLNWLASESPFQPILCSVKIRELVHTYHDSFSGLRDSINYSRLGPNDCISVFNEALDCSMQQIIAAVNANPSGWPCPEIGLLDKSSDEDRVAKRNLPIWGWSSNARIEPIICALRDCKLPTFIDDLSWLARGSNIRQEIDNHKLRLENSLIHYLTHTSMMMGASLAMKEAHVIVQTCARLELHGSSYCIVPQWSVIFGRIINWRLQNLCGGELSSVYISKCYHVALPGPDLDVLRDEASLRSSSSYYQSISLDEMIEVSFSLPLLVKGQQIRHEALQHLPQRDSNTNFIIHHASNLMDGESNYSLIKQPGISTVCTYGLNNSGNEAENLRKLLKQCDLLQDVIDEKLSMYF
ncbi:SAC3 family protein B [Senna tora]|uniref:SAC3 family protein B n=1 Tax=Senna tora TaxID=362788 RepID=A0A834X2U6_9FABA|nr:SAC3 family protein B [Senna tora]